MNGAAFVGEFDDNVNGPRPAGRRVVASPLIMIRNSGRDVRRDACVVAVRVDFALQNVDEPLRTHELIIAGNRIAKTS